MERLGIKVGPIVRPKAQEAGILVGEDWSPSLRGVEFTLPPHFKKIGPQWGNALSPHWWGSMSHTQSTHLCANPFRECCNLDVKYHPLLAHTPLPSDFCVDIWFLVTSTVLKVCGIFETVVQREEVGCGKWALGDYSFLILMSLLFPDVRRCEEPQPQAPSTLPSPPQ